MIVSNGNLVKGLSSLHIIAKLLQDPEANVEVNQRGDVADTFANIPVGGSYLEHSVGILLGKDGVASLDL